MMPLPECSHRGQIYHEIVECRSNRWMHDGTVPLELCHTCRYANRENLDLVALQTPPQGIRPVEPVGLGDLIEGALTAVGITKQRVEAFVGQPCGCEERKQKLNQLGAWAMRILSGKRDKAEQYLNEIVDQPK